MTISRLKYEDWDPHREPTTIRGVWMGDGSVMIYGCNSNVGEYQFFGENDGRGQSIWCMPEDLDDLLAGVIQPKDRKIPIPNSMIEVDQPTMRDIGDGLVELRQKNDRLILPLEEFKDLVRAFRMYDPAYYDPAYTVICKASYIKRYSDGKEERVTNEMDPEHDYYAILKTWGWADDKYSGIYVEIQDDEGHEVWQSGWEDPRDLPNSDFVLALRNACAIYGIDLNWDLSFWDLMETFEEEKVWELRRYMESETSTGTGSI